MIKFLVLAPYQLNMKTAEGVYQSLNGRTIARFQNQK